MAQRNSKGQFIKGHSLGVRFEKGHIPWHKGKKGIMPIPWNKGKELDTVVKEKISLANKGKHNSLSTEFKKGNVPYSVINGVSIETREKISKTLSGRKQTKEEIEKRRQKLIGKTRTEEQRKRISEALKGEKNPLFGKKLSKEHIRKCLRRRPISSLEIKVQKVINKYSLPYRFVGNGKFFIERKNPDFININGEKKAVEVYARKHKELFRGNVEGWKQDRIKTFSKYGWKIIFIEDWQTNKDETILNLLKGGG